MKKAKNHRKRHVPPGPCGIWFQAQQQLTKQAGNATSDGTRTSSSRSQRQRVDESSSPFYGDEEEEHSQGDDPTNHEQQQQQRHHSSVVEDLSFSPAWTLMQQELNLVTPYLPPTLSDPAERYRQLRPHMPSNYVLLWEVQQGHYDFSLKDKSSSQESVFLLVLVTRVESHIHHNIWTVELQDETGVTLKAWVEPKLVRQQLEQTHESSLIRAGVVWCLDNISMVVGVVPPTSSDDEERLERMLLVRGSAIHQVWTPEQMKRLQQQGNDTPGLQRQFLEWMERRKALPLIETNSTHEGEGEGQHETGSECEVDGETMDDELLDTVHASMSRRPKSNREIQEEEEEVEEECCEPGDLLGLSHPRTQQNMPRVDLVANSGFLRRPEGGSTQQSESQATSRYATQESTSHHRYPWTRLCLDDVPASPQAQDINNNKNSGIEERDTLSLTNASTPPTELPNHAPTAARTPVPIETAASSRQNEYESRSESIASISQQQVRPTIVETKSKCDGATVQGQGTTTTLSHNNNQLQSLNMWSVPMNGTGSKILWNMMDEDDDGDSDDPGKDKTTMEFSSKVVDTRRDGEVTKSHNKPPTVPGKDQEDSDDDDYLVPPNLAVPSMFSAANMGGGVMNFAHYSDDEDDDDD